MDNQHNYVDDIGDGKRRERCINISIALLTAWNDLTEADRVSGQKFVIKSKMREFILSHTKGQYKDKLGDSRAHGDACGGHGLHLEMVGTGAHTQILLNESNANKCKEFLDRLEFIDNTIDDNEVILK